MTFPRKEIEMLIVSATEPASNLREALAIIEETWNEMSGRLLGDSASKAEAKIRALAE